MKRLKVGDYVREIDGRAVGIVVHIMENADVVVVNWPPSQHGLAFHPGDLVLVSPPVNLPLGQKIALQLEIRSAGANPHS